MVVLEQIFGDVLSAWSRDDYNLNGRDLTW